MNRLYSMDTLAALGVSPLPGFEDRLLQQKRWQLGVVTSGKEGGQWVYASGDYSDRRYDVRLGKSREEQRVSFEQFLSEQISLQREKHPDRPAVVVGLGDGAAFSLRHIADKYEGSIREGEVVLVVTNLAARYSDRKGLMRYVNCTFAELPELTVTQPSGERLPLRNNVVGLYERLAATRHSLVPELDLPMATQVLAHDSIYMLLARDLATTSPEKTLRNLAHNAMVGQRGLIPHEMCSLSAIDGWKIYRKP